MFNIKWTVINGFKDYEISNVGQVMSYKRTTPSLLKPNFTYDGYRYVNLYNGEGKKFKKISRLVATHFVPNPNSKPQVNHKDGNKYNDVYLNLEWTTPKENSQHAVEMGLRRDNSGENNSQCKLSDKEVREIREKYDNGILQRVLANEYNVTRPHISQLVNKNRR